MKKELSPLQNDVMRWANGGWVLTVRGNVVYAGGDRIATYATVSNLVRRGMLWKVNDTTWAAVKTDRQRRMEAESEISAE